MAATPGYTFESAFSNAFKRVLGRPQSDIGMQLHVPVDARCIFVDRYGDQSGANAARDRTRPLYDDEFLAA
jgi:hypothetical protein